jgi:5-methylcytosine-specific restriction protein A
MSWRRLRDWHIANHPLCNDCALNGRSVAATDVHHKIPFNTGKTEEEKWNLLLDPDNLVSLCKECHIERHKKLHME